MSFPAQAPGPPGRAAKGDGSAIVPVILKEGPVHEAFLKVYVKKTAKKFSAFWKKIVFTGTGTPPKSFPDDEKLIAFVAQTKGAVGYIAKADAAPAGVKVLEVK